MNTSTRRGLSLRSIATTLFLVVLGCSAARTDSTESVRTTAARVTGSVVTQVAGGHQYSCAVLSSGGVRCWGVNKNGWIGDGTEITRTAPVPATGVGSATMLAAGSNHVCVLLSNGLVNCWGYSGEGQLGTGDHGIHASAITVVGISTAKTISAGENYSCAVMRDETARCWGDNTSGKLGDGTTTERASPIAVSGLGNLATISTGRQHSCALTDNGIVYCWGDNTTGQLGDGTNTNSLTPVQVQGLAGTVTAIAEARDHTCALLANATVQCWGSNGVGELGDGSLIDRNSPVTVSGLTGATAIGLGSYHSCALINDGTVSCWGDNPSGQIGDGTTTRRTTPVQVSGITSAVAISNGGEYHSCAVLSNDTVQCWGDNSYDQLGDGRPQTSLTPSDLEISPAGIPTAVTQGDDFGCAFFTGGTSRCWGVNASGQLSNGTQTTTASPTQSTWPVGRVPTAKISAGTSHFCSVLDNSAVACSGKNTNGQLGVGDTTDRSTAVSAMGGLLSVDVAAGDAHTCVRLGAQTVWCAGANYAGQLGNNTTVDSTSPVQVTGLTDATALASGYAHSCVVSFNGGAPTVKCWGNNGNGQLGTGSTTSSSVPVTISGGFLNASAVAAGTYSTCMLLTDGTVYCWGYNGYGQLGDGTRIDRNAPAQVSGITTATAIDVADNHACAILTGGTVKCWGDNTYGQLGNDTTTSSSTPVTVTNLSNASTITAGKNVTCVTRTSDKVSCWGDDGRYGQLGRGNVFMRKTPVNVALLAITDAVNHTSRHGDSVTFTLSVPDDGTGTISFTDNSTPIAGCDVVLPTVAPGFSSTTKTCTTSELPTGVRLISATRPGNTQYASTALAADTFDVTPIASVAPPTPPTEPAPTPTPAAPPEAPAPPPAANGATETPPPASNSIVTETQAENGVTIGDVVPASLTLTATETGVTTTEVAVTQTDTGTVLTVPAATKITDKNNIPISSIALTIVPNQKPLAISSAGDGGGAATAQFASPVLRLGPTGTQFKPPIPIVLPVRDDKIEQASCWSCRDDVTTVAPGICNKVPSERFSFGKLQCHVDHFSVVFALTAEPSGQASEGGSGMASSAPAASAKKSGCSLSPIGSNSSGASPFAAIAVTALLARRRSYRSEMIARSARLLA